MSQRNFATLMGALCVSCFAIGCAKLSESPNVGTNTNWLKTCSRQSECGDGRSCLCGVCTQACNSDTQCGAVHEATRCEPLSVDACGSGSASSSACLQSCRSNAECTSIEHGVCRDGLCLPASSASSEADSSTGDASMSTHTPPAQDAGSTPVAGGLELSRRGATVVIGDAYTACTTHDDCVLVGTSCNGCCEQGAIDQTLRQSYQEESEKACADYQGGMCDCDFLDVVPRCEGGRCRALERDTLECYSPTQNLDRAYDRELVGCACSEREDWICARATTMLVALRCRQVEGSTRAAWGSAYDGPCALTMDETCMYGEIRAGADACLAEFSTCYVLESGEYCGRP